MTRDDILKQIEARGIRMFSDTDRLNRASSAANTCLFAIGDTLYVLDPAFGARRRKELRPYLQTDGPLHVLCSHYHNDHCANNGWAAGRGSRIYYHHWVRTRIHYLRTNGTGQILTMAREMELPDMLRRFRMFPGWMVRGMLLSSRLSRLFPAAALFAVSYLYSLNSVGLIRPGRSRAVYLTPEARESIDLDHTTITGWRIDDGLFAMEAPGHSEDHLVYYLKDQKALFAGDALNFLNANDIQYGDVVKIDQTFDRLHDFVTKEGVDVLFQGHYYPLFGTDAIAGHIDTIRHQHKHVHEAARSVIASFDRPFGFDEALSALLSHPSDLVQYLARITFPRSTLVFLDVYLLHTIKSLGYVRGKDRLWRRPDVCD
ncbi:hypothetical protein JCM14469_08080 [Desulfatiferula olefinivorans]